MGRGAVYACKMFFYGNISREDRCPQCKCHSVRMYLLRMWGSRGWEQFSIENMAFRGSFFGDIFTRLSTGNITRGDFSLQ